MRSGIALREPSLDASWPESWKRSHAADRIEVFGERSNLGQAYVYRNRFERTLRTICELADPGARILDVAAAQGNYSIALARRGFDVTWNDLRTELIGYVDLKAGGAPIRYLPGNVFELECTEPFDLVLVAEVIEHVAHPDGFLAKVATFVRPGGFVVLTTPNGEYCRYRAPKFSECVAPEEFEDRQFAPDAEGHIFLMHYDEIDGLARGAGLVPVRVELLSNVLTCGHLKTEYALRILPRAWIGVVESLTTHLPRAASRILNSAFVVTLERPRDRAAA